MDEMTIHDLLEHAVVINLNKDAGRLLRVNEQFASKGLPTPQRINAILGRELPNIALLKKNMKTSGDADSVVGCALSHLLACKTIIDNEWNYGLILEDDITLTDSLNKVLNLPVPRDWDVLFLGHCRGKWPRNACSRVQYYDSNIDSVDSIDSINERFIRFTSTKNSPMGTWAYAVTADMARYVLNNYKLVEPIDVFMVSQEVLDQKNVYGTIPSLITHCYDFGSHTSQKGVETGSRKSKRKIIVITLLSILVLVCLYASIKTKSKKARIGLIASLLIAVTALACFIVHWTRKSNRQCYEYGIDAFDPFANVWSDQSRKQCSLLLERMNSKGNVILAYGSLLGWARHDGAVIPWDDDVDVLMTKEDALELYKELQKDPNVIITPGNANYNAKISWKTGNAIPNYDYTHPFIDIFYYNTNVVDTTNGTHVLEIPLPKQRIELNKPFTTFTDRFEGVSVQIPTEYRTILNALYGPNCLTECVSSSWNHRQECGIDKRYTKKIKCELL